MTPELAHGVAAAVGAEPVGFERSRGKGYTHNERWLVRFADGQSAFVKAAVDDMTAAGCATNTVSTARFARTSSRL
jgi:hypothetical protein